MRKTAIVLLLSIFLLSSCTTVTDIKKAENEAPVSTTKEAESSGDIEIDISSETEHPEVSNVETEPLTNEPQASNILVCNTLTAPRIMLPYHDADNLPTDFILAMQNNPIDRDYRETCWNDPGMSSIGVAGEYSRDYEKIWRNEINLTVDQIVAYWGEDYRSTLETYAVLSLEQANALGVECDLFYNEKINFGRYMLALEGIRQSLDACRNTAFMLKYYLYLTECKKNGKAEQSLLYSFETEASHEYDEEYTVVPRGTCVIDMTLSPAYSHESGEEFAAQMRECLAEKHNATYWNDIMFSEMRKIHPLCREEVFVRYCSDYFAFCSQQWIIEDELKADGCITVSEEQKDSRMWVATRQLAIKLQYWQYLLDTEPQLP